MDNQMNELISKCEALKTVQNHFISNNKYYPLNERYAAPELNDSPNVWMKEYVEFGGTKSKPADIKSRLQQLIDLSGQNTDFMEIIKIIKSSNNENIIWNIEENYKSTNFSWDNFNFSIVITILSSIIKDNKSIQKWLKEHSDGWMKPYKAP